MESSHVFNNVWQNSDNIVQRCLIMISRTARSPTIGALPRREALAFLSLFFVPAIAQAILLTVVPLQALYLLGSARAVTLLYVGAGLVTVVGRFSIPYLVSFSGRRFVFSLGAVSLSASSIMLALDQVPALASGLVLSAFAFACIEVASHLYLLDGVSRQALKHFEPVRIFASAGPWTLGPWFGVYLQQEVDFVAPYAVAAGAAAFLLILFWWLQLGENVTPTAMPRRPRTPVRYLRRFFVQPRLRLAWALAAARSSWWNMFYVYTPIFAVTSGLGAETGGIIVDRHSLDLAGAALGLGWTPVRPAPPVGRRVRRGGSSEHLRRQHVLDALNRSDTPYGGGAGNRNHRRCWQPVVPARGPPVRTRRDDDCVCQLPRRGADWSACRLLCTVVTVHSAIGFRCRRPDDAHRLGALKTHSWSIVR